MRRHALRWGVALVLAAGMLLALLVYFLLSGSLLQFGFRLHPSVVVLAPAIAAAAVLLGVESWQRREQARLKQALVAQAAELEELRRQFIRRLDHELKNPLTAILAGLAYVDESTLSPQQQGVLASVQRHVRRLSQLVHDLQRMATLETCELNRAPVDVSDLVDETLELARDGFRALPAVRRDHALQKDVRESPWPQLTVLGDRELLLLAAYNLVANACKYSPSGTMVEVRAFQDGPWVCIEVVDQGTGIAEKDLAHVGEQLYRGQASRGVPGSGLGLAMVQTIVTRHGGRLVLSSEEGAGTVAAVRLPAFKSPPSVVVGQEQV